MPAPPVTPSVAAHTAAHRQLRAILNTPPPATPRLPQHGSFGDLLARQEGVALPQAPAAATRTALSPSPTPALAPLRQPLPPGPALALQPAVAPATGVIRPVLQADPAEYATAEEARRWGGSSCSAASLAAVLRGLTGQAVRVGEVVRALEAAGGITVAQGLVSRPALVATARRFGLAVEDRALSYDQLTAAVRGGPVLVDVTNGQFPQGHWLVVTGADAQGVSLTDSSGYRLQRMSRADFQAAWSGRGMPVAAPAQTAWRMEGAPLA